MCLENGVIIDSGHWVWCVYDSEQIAHRVHNSVLLTNPQVIVSDVSFLIYDGQDAYGFRIHK